MGVPTAVWVLCILAVTLLPPTMTDMPSCDKARCLHCDVEFIARMCPQVCSRCPRTVFIANGQKLKIVPENARPKKEIAQMPNTQIRQPVKTNTQQHFNQGAQVARQPAQPTPQFSAQQQGAQQTQFGQQQQQFTQQNTQYQQQRPVQYGPTQQAFGQPQYTQQQQPQQQQHLPQVQFQLQQPPVQFQQPQQQFQAPQPQQGYQQPQQQNGQYQQQSGQYQQQTQQQQYQQYQQQQQQIVVTPPPPTPAVTPSQAEAVTLAPMIHPPSAEELNSQLIEQQRMLAQQRQANPFGALGGGLGGPSAGAGLFGPLPPTGSAPGALPGLGGPGAGGQTPFFNPFQQFLGQGGAGADLLNPFHLPTLPPMGDLFTTPSPVQPLPQPQAQPQQPQEQPQQQFGVPNTQPQIGNYPPVPGHQLQQLTPYPIQQQGQYPQQQGVNANNYQQITPTQQGGQQQQQIPPSPPTPQQLQSPNGQPQTSLTMAGGQGNAIVARSVDGTNTQYEKNFYANGNVASSMSAQKQFPQCPRQPNWQPCISKPEANGRFQNCCRRLGDGCMPLCNYDATLATMQLAVLTGRCPIGKVREIMVCASGYQDATPCCEAYNVFERGYEHCRPYCNPAAGLPEGGLLSEKYKCLVKLSFIQQCFYASQKPANYV